MRGLGRIGRFPEASVDEAEFVGRVGLAWKQWLLGLWAFGSEDGLLMGNPFPVNSG